MDREFTGAPVTRRPTRAARRGFFLARGRPGAPRETRAHARRRRYNLIYSLCAVRNINRPQAQRFGRSGAWQPWTHRVGLAAHREYRSGGERKPRWRKRCWRRDTFRAPSACHAAARQWPAQSGSSAACTAKSLCSLAAGRAPPSTGRPLHLTCLSQSRHYLSVPPPNHLTNLVHANCNKSTRARGRSEGLRGARLHPAHGTRELAHCWAASRRTRVGGW